MDIQLSDRTVQLLKSFIPGVTSKQASEVTGMPIQVVTGSLASMKKRNLVVITDGVITLTKDGEKAIGLQKVIEVKEVKVHVAKPESKVAKAEVVIVEFLGKIKRKELIEKLVQEVGLTKQGASTYVYNYGCKIKKLQVTQ